ncbi:PREDICTED: LOW QUALITY PROTEIN: UPF0481 protein At3g47200-like [Camelina sativa]|uniref:LOW QUALITY PROTEIN: UPF0481 protein At3g47200-like n=1 Tax=Camelina sativa TaxID=90675 RepID=A0ABM0TGP6_CAMSA|nr:PREDICTED: LOW QUALITY PROTEIN: UPF0481 protein At3g47200-like [Camelina sativa]
MADKTEIISSLSDKASLPLSPLPTESCIISTELRNYLSSRCKEPVLLLESAGKESCCIFRVPESFVAMNPEAYKPKVVSIGPYHYGEKHLQMIQQHKLRFLKLFLDEARKNGVDENVLVKAVTDSEEKIRKSNSEELRVDDLEPKEQHSLMFLMVLDGCFILMLFLIVSSNIGLNEENDPLFTIPWILLSIQSDLLLLENQVLFFVLQTLYVKSKIGLPGDLNRIAFEFFKRSIDKQGSYWEKHRNFQAKHLLDLIRKTFLPNMRSVGESETTSSQDVQLHEGNSGKVSSSDSTGVVPLILSAKRLRLQGIKFRLRRIEEEDSILDIKLKKNRLQIPLLRFDGFISSFFLNCVAFEQFYTDSSNDITSYVVFMGCLLDGEEDVTFLRNEKLIIENHFGSNSEVSEFFKSISKDVLFEIHTSYLNNVFKGVNEYTKKWYNGLWAGFKHTHFESPWTCLSSFAVVFVIFLTMLQAIVAILSFLNDKKDDGNAAPPLGLP